MNIYNEQNISNTGAVETLKTAALFVLVVGSVGILAHQVLTLPEVYKSHSTNLCAKVVDSNGDTIPNGCDNVPPRHFTVWIK